MSSHQSAEELKNLGNKYFKACRYQEAIDAYSKAIIKNPEVATYFTNRALCYYQTKNWEKSIADCRKASELDRKSCKAYYFWGRAVIQLEQYDEAIKLLTIANDLVHTQKINYGDEITSQLRLARREKFRKEEDKRITQEIELQTYLNRLIDEDLKRQLESLRSSEKTADDELLELNEDQPKKQPKSVESRDRKENTDAEKNSEHMGLEEEEFTAKALSAKDKLNSLFGQVDDRRRRREIPDYLCGKISFELLKEPVITPSGITYDRADIREHLQRVGHFDPVTRAPLTEDLLIPNLAMREVVDNFLSENSWALHDMP